MRLHQHQSGMHHLVEVSQASLQHLRRELMLRDEHRQRISHLTVDADFMHGGGGARRAAVREVTAAAATQDAGGVSKQIGRSVTVTSLCAEDDGGDPDPEPEPEPNAIGTGRHLPNKDRRAASVPDAFSSELALWRLPTVLAVFPVSRSGWLAGVKSGRFPQPVRLGPRTVAWRSADIRALIGSM